MPDQLLERIIKMYESMSIDKIAREVGISRHKINSMLKSAGVKLRGVGPRKGYNKNKL